MKRYWLIAGSILFLAILALLLKPQVSGGRTPKTSARINTHQIALSHYQISIAGNRKSKVLGNTVNEWALSLAKVGGPNITVLYWAGESRPEKSMDERIYNEIHGIDNKEFLESTLSYDVAPGHYSESNDISNIPLIWTTGLQSDGTWVKDSPWDGEGGHVAFADGRTVWVEGRAQFKKYGTEEITHDVSEALPLNRKILRANKADYDRLGSMYHL